MTTLINQDYQIRLGVKNIELRPLSHGYDIVEIRQLKKYLEETEHAFNDDGDYLNTDIVVTDADGDPDDTETIGDRDNAETLQAIFISLGVL